MSILDKENRIDVDNDGKEDVVVDGMPLVGPDGKPISSEKMTNAMKKRLAYYQEFDNQHEAIRGKVKTMNQL